MNYLKNPIIIGVSVCLLIMAIMYYKRLGDVKKNKNGKQIPFNFITPLAIGIVAWFVAETLINKTTVPEKIIQPTINQPIINNPIIESKKIGGHSETIGTDATNTYNIISKDNIKLPSMDVFIDLANF